MMRTIKIDGRNVVHRSAQDTQRFLGGKPCGDERASFVVAQRGRHGTDVALAAEPFDTRSHATGARPDPGRRGSHIGDAVVGMPRSHPETVHPDLQGCVTAHGCTGGDAVGGSITGHGSIWQSYVGRQSATASVPAVFPARWQPVLDEARPLADLFFAAGYRLYLVGGVVRDLLADRNTDRADLDFTTDAVPAEISRIVGPWATSVWNQGERFGTIGAQRDGRLYEITTHRSEHYVPDSRKPDVQFSTDVGEDLSRRDFTVNAIALEVTGDEPVLIDPFDGCGDLVRKVLRTPRSPEQSFRDDPLRMIRAARFIAGYGLVPDAELVAAASADADRLEIVSPERIRDELDKLMVVEDPSVGLWYLYDTGLSDRFLPELSAMRVEQDPIHRHKDVLTHSIAVVANTRARVDGAPNLVVRLAALFHDVGKPKTRSIGGNGVSFHHHEVVGARMTRERMKALRYSNDMIDTVSNLVYLHLRFHTYQMGWTDSAVRRFVRDADDQLDQLIELTRCDCTTRNQRKAAMLGRRMDELELRIDELAKQEELAAMRPDLDGRDVIEHLGLEPGPIVGQALAHLLELRLEHGPLGRGQALEHLDRWWADRAPGATPGGD